METARKGLFAQLVVVPLFHRHRILTQVAADNVNIVKLLPPLIAGQEEVDQFVAALDDVLQDAHKNSGLLFEFGKTLVKSGSSGSTADARAATPPARRPPASSSTPGTACSSREQSGFVGSAVARALLARGLAVVALTAAGSRPPRRRGARCGDRAGVGRPARRRRRAQGRGRLRVQVFHVAAIYRFWTRDPDEFYDVNVGGNPQRAGRRPAAPDASGSSTRAPSARSASPTTPSAPPADETSVARVGHLFGSYKRSKYVAEHEVLRAAAQGLPVTLVQPTFPVRAARPISPTPSGKLVLDFLPNGKMPGYVETALNVVDVEDVAAGHLLAAERGQCGRSYILGGEEPSRLPGDPLAARRDPRRSPRPTRRFPRRLALMAAHVSEAVEGTASSAASPPSRSEGTRMATARMVFDDIPRPPRSWATSSRTAPVALARSARWYADNGYVVPGRLRSQIVWAEQD